ncbi:MAG TPA: succinate dehydrogenase/fumarate reductase iron-sulfur subunit [Flavobacteriales bacterium]|nr:succinate dehydrogenase/fumarate reductase iron-sulfur subunit [Flavobacteriales bacterium]HCA83706.1 succinate dehydrogenase/fumarate reductase iron-sulfur subunit [Flavobacteriales bacterium]HRE73561.1 succinate dehydrogenase/fumarate reductase iron-sulfur subunit [Flavobacteriales bacterium]HRE97166.1 succinate dehydrogenase/fumarate reductase iron-sulfur subunit [Flavobacteriales bacterium]HRJ34498.1 succinate dehydrogenase/fumarate reductase iron-sulfur subunit [Flavobacteriales bacteri
MKLNLKIWRQKNREDKGKMVDYSIDHVSPDMSFLEMLDVLNEQLINKGDDPIAFDHDCREGICGMCSLFINGRAHGPNYGVTTCQLHMRSFKDGDTIFIEPWRAQAFPVIKDLAVDRSAFDRVIQAGGYVSANTGGAQDANCLPVPKENADKAFAAATCIGCGACVATCKNGSAMLFVSAKVSQLALLPQGKAEAQQRVLNMVAQMDAEGFGNCSNTGACEIECPKGISLENIARMNREFMKASILSEK